jgi:hypothetical protein
VHDWEEVETSTDFVAYLQLLAEDFEADAHATAELRRNGQPYADGEWAHSTTGAFLESWAAWLGRRLEPDLRWELTEVEPPTWQTMAINLAAARVYE